MSVQVPSEASIAAMRMGRSRFQEELADPSAKGCQLGAGSA